MASSKILSDGKNFSPDLESATVKNFQIIKTLTLSFLDATEMTKPFDHWFENNSIAILAAEKVTALRTTSLWIRRFLLKCRVFINDLYFERYLFVVLLVQIHKQMMITDLSQLKPSPVHRWPLTHGQLVSHVFYEEKRQRTVRKAKSFACS